MNEAREIAARLGMRTGDQVSPPVEEARMRSGHPKGQTTRWTSRRRDAFGWIAPVSISLVATDGPISLTIWQPGGCEVRERIGHNRAVWPARVVNGAVARDAATTTWNKFPGLFLGTQARLWTLREFDRDRLSLSIVDLIAARGEAAERDGGHGAMDKGFHDLGPDLDLGMFEFEMHDIAKRLGVLAWSDEDLVRWLDSLSRRVDAMTAERPEVRWGEKLVSKLAWRDVEVWERDLKGGR